MTRPAHEGGAPPLGPFLEYLRHKGFEVGVRHYIYAHELLARLGERYDPRALEGQGGEPARAANVYGAEDLKTLLCPLFARTAEEQRRFHALFTESAFAEFAAWLMSQPEPVTATGLPPTDDAEDGDGRKGEGGPAETGPPKSEPDDDENGARPDAEPPRRRLLRRAAPVLLALGLAFVAAALIYKWRSQRPAPPPDPTPSPTVEVARAGVPVPTQTAAPPMPGTPTPTPTPTPATRGPSASFYPALASLFFLAFLLYEAAVRRRLHDALERQRAKSPPFRWPLEVAPPAVALYDSAEFHNAARLLRRRQTDEFHRLDVRATVGATVRAFGYPTFRYASASKVPEYLVLTERASASDHLSRLFTELVAALRRENLLVTQYFYEDNPRACSDADGRPVNLSELAGNARRLLILGSGGQLLDPIKGRLHEWTDIFDGWRERAVLTPEPRWGLREHVLRQRFVVVPADARGLSMMLAHFESPAARSSSNWSPGGVVDLARDFDAPATAVARLRGHLGEDIFQWLCACALHDELEWGLTLRLGMLPAMGASFVNEESLLRLCRLPWFRAGALPDWLRPLLLAELEGGREREARALLKGLLGASPQPPAGTFAADARRLELALQDWVLRRDAPSRRELREAVKEVPPGHVLRDEVLLRQLETLARSPLAALLPQSLQRLLYRNRLPVFGLTTAARFLFTALLFSLAALLFRAEAIPAPPPFRPQPTPTATPTPDVTPTPTPTPSPSPTSPPTPEMTPIIAAPSPDVSPSPTRSPSPEPSPCPLRLSCPASVAINETAKITLQEEGYPILSVMFMVNGRQVGALRTADAYTLEVDPKRFGGEDLKVSVTGMVGGCPSAYTSASCTVKVTGAPTSPVGQVPPSGGGTTRGGTVVKPGTGPEVIQNPTPAAGGAAAPIKIRQIEIPKTQYRVPDSPRTVSRIVLHDTFGPFEGTINIMRGRVPNTRASAHYVINRDGAVYRLVDDANIAFHAGQNNADSIGVEMVNYPDREDYTPAQLNALIALLRDLTGRYRLNPDGIVTHGELEPDRRGNENAMGKLQQIRDAVRGASPAP